MNAFSRPYDLNIPALTPALVRLWMEKTQDLVLLISADESIAGAFQSNIFDMTDVNHWIGQPLTALVSKESQVKIPMLLKNDASLHHSDAIWRHINLTDHQGNTIPVRALYMTLQNDNDLMRCLVCRDLRSIQDLSNRFNGIQQDLQNENFELRASLQHKEQVLDGQALNVQQIVGSIKQSTYKQVISEIVQSLERACMQALLNETAGDHQRAAQMAGCELKDWLNQAAALKIT